MKQLPVIGAATLLVITFSSNAQEIKCPQVFMNEAETTICNSEELLALDRQMAELYRVVRELTSNIKKDQKAWSKERKNCKSDTVCIESLYRARIELFQSKLNQTSAAAGENPVAEGADAAEVEPSLIESNIERSFPRNIIASSAEKYADVVSEPQNNTDALSGSDNRQEKPPVRSVRPDIEGPSKADVLFVVALVLAFPFLVQWFWRNPHFLSSRSKLWRMSLLEKALIAVVYAMCVELFLAFLYF
jgi:uncharacterized protein